MESGQSILASTQLTRFACSSVRAYNYLGLSCDGSSVSVAEKAKRVAGEMPSPTPMSVVIKPLYKYLDDLEFSL